MTCHPITSLTLFFCCLGHSWVSSQQNSAGRLDGERYVGDQ